MGPTFWINWLTLITSGALNPSAASQHVTCGWWFSLFARVLPDKNACQFPRTTLRGVEWTGPWSHIHYTTTVHNVTIWDLHSLQTPRWYRLWSNGNIKDAPVLNDPIRHCRLSQTWAQRDWPSPNLNGSVWQTHADPSTKSPGFAIIKLIQLSIIIIIFNPSVGDFGIVTS